MKGKAKYIWIGIGVAAIITGYWLYSQYNKLMDYCIKFKNVKVYSIGIDGTVFDVFLDLTNKSDLKIDVISQSYKVYLNDKLVSDASSNKSQTIEPNATSQVGVNVKFSPRSVLKAININEFLLSRQNIKLRVDIDIRAGIGPIKANIPYVYETTLNELMKGSGENKSASNSKKC